MYVDNLCNKNQNSALKVLDPSPPMIFCCFLSVFFFFYKEKQEKYSSL